MAKEKRVAPGMEPVPEGDRRTRPVEDPQPEK